MTDESDKKMGIWNAIEKTNPAYAKDFRRAGGFAGTDINPVYRMKRMTELFGPCGQGWGWTLHNQWREDFHVGDGELSCVFTAVSVWYMIDAGLDQPMTRCETGIQIGGTIADRTPDESYKMAITDALGKCFVALGLSADVYMGEYDSKYHREEAQPRARTPAARPPAARTAAPAAPPSFSKYTRDRPICPECGVADTTIESKYQLEKGKWTCFKKKGGCGFQWDAGVEQPSRNAGDMVTDSRTRTALTQMMSRLDSLDKCEPALQAIEQKNAEGYLSQEDLENFVSIVDGKRRAFAVAAEQKTAF